MVIVKKKVPGASATSLARFAKRAAKLAGLPGEFNILLTGDAEVRAMNERFRGQDHSTDVLTFPGAEPGFAGEVAVAAGVAGANARAHGHTAAQEIKILILHGILHLRGYDHERDQGKMFRREDKLRLALRLPTGLIARNSGGSPLPARRKPPKTRLL